MRGPALPAEGHAASEAEVLEGPTFRSSSVEPSRAHPSSQEVAATVLCAPGQLGQDDSSQTGIGHGSEPRPCAVKATEALDPNLSVGGGDGPINFGYQSPSQTGSTSGPEPLQFCDAAQEAISFSQTGAVNDSAPSAEVHCTRSSSLVGEPVFHGQPTVKPSAEQCDGLLASLRAASWPPNSRSSLTAVTTLLPELIREVNSFISSVWPSGFWNAVCIGRNTSARPHRDLANAPNSSNLTVSLGASQGGQLWVEDPLGKTPVCMPTGELLDGALHSTRSCFPAISGT